MHHDDTPPTPDEPGARPVAPDESPRARLFPAPASLTSDGLSAFADAVEYLRSVTTKRAAERSVSAAPEGDQ